MPRKNVRLLAGRSLIRRTVQTAIESGCFARVIVSTDDLEIAAEALAAGAEVPFVRPAALADDHATSLAVLLHAANYLQQESLHKAEAVCLLQPTSPFLRSEQIQAAVERLLAGKFNSLSTMKEVVELPEWMFIVDEALGQALPESSPGITKPRSLIKKRFIENGALYLTRLAFLQETGAMYDFSSHGYLIMSAAESVDIDTIDDWNYAEFLCRR